jgi:hypothetical protein
MFKRVPAVACALALMVLATAAIGGAAMAAPRSQAQTGRITGIAVDPSDPLKPRGPQLTTVPQASAGTRHFNGLMSRFSAGQRVRQ